MALALAAVTASAALAGCGVHGGSDADAPLARVLSSTASDDGPFAGLTGHQILERANAAMREATSFTIRQDGTQGGHPTHLRTVMADGGRCTVDMRTDTERMQIISTGDWYYVKATTSLWKSMGAPSTMLRALAGKWLRLPATVVRRSGAIARACDKSQYMDGMSSSADTGTLTKRAPTALGRTRVLPVLHVKPTGTSTVYVAMTGDPYVVEVQAETPTVQQKVTETFSAFGRYPRITAPPDAQIVDPSQLGAPKGFSV